VSHVVIRSCWWEKKGCVTGFMLCCAGCKRKIAINKDTFFDGAYLQLPKLLGLMYFFLEAAEKSTDSGRRQENCPD